MNLADWQRNGWLRPHTTGPQEIADLMAIVERDLCDSREAAISPDWRFGIAYNAALKLCTILLYAEGYRPEQGASHHRTIACLPVILGEARQDDAGYLDACRRKRNAVEYDRAGGVTVADAEELTRFTDQLKDDVSHWLRNRRPELL